MAVTAHTVARPVAEPVQTKTAFAFVHINKCGGSSIEIALGVPKVHATAQYLRDEMGAEDWASRFTFAIVRNPFDRVASIYYYRVRTDQGGMSDRHLNLNDWISAVWDARDPRYRDNDLLLAPAWAWVADESGLIVDHIGRQETLAEDWRTICGRLGIEKDLPRTNYNSHPPYRDVMTDRSRAILERAFATDLEQFGYRY